MILNFEGGVTIIFTPMAKLVFDKLRNLKLQIFKLLFFMMAANLLSILLKYINKITFDQVFYNKNIHFLMNKMLYVIVVIMLLLLCVGLLNKYWSSKLYTFIDIKLKMDFYKDIIYSEYLFFKNTGASDIYYRMFSDLNIFSTYVMDVFLNTPIKIIYMAICSLFMFKWSLLLSCVYYGLLIISIICIILTKKYVDNISKQQREIEQRLVGFVNEDFAKIKAIKACGIESWKIKKAKNKFESFSQIQIKNKFLLSFFEVVNHFSDNIWSVLYIVLGAYLVYNDKITIGAFISFVSMTASVSAITYSLLNLIYIYPQAKVCFKRYIEYTGNKNELEFSGEQYFSFEDELRINNLSYSYPNSDIQVLKNISFVAVPNSVVVIRGGNGIGKTTLENILARWIAYDKYEITIDHKNIFDISGRDFKSNIGYFYQDIDVFNTTFIENIILGRECVNINYVIRLINQINMKCAVEIMPNGMNTYIGEGGYQLSAGNIQKLGIIRTLSARPKIVLFDEPTENLDKQSKECFIEIIKEYIRENQALILIVSHDDVTDSLESIIINL